MWNSVASHESVTEKTTSAFSQTDSLFYLSTFPNNLQLGQTKPSIYWVKFEIILNMLLSSCQLPTEQRNIKLPKKWQESLQTDSQHWTQLLKTSLNCQTQIADLMGSICATLTLAANWEKVWSSTRRAIITYSTSCFNKQEQEQIIYFKPFFFTWLMNVFL